METEKPRRKPGTSCPLWRKDVSKVCHTCEWYIQLVGKNPQGENVFNNWCCSIAALPWIAVENSQMQRQTGAAIESFRNEVIHQHAQAMTFMVAGQFLPPGSETKLIDGKS